MSSVRIKGDTSGYVDLTASAAGGNLTVGNGTNNPLFIDAVNDRIGFGTNSPSSKVEIFSPSSAIGVGNLALNTSSTSGASRISFKESGSTVGQVAYSHDNNNLELIANESGSGIVFYTNGTNERMRLDASGRITVPNQPVFWSWNGQGSTTGITSDQLLTFGSTDLNVGSHYSTSTGRFTAPVAGLYEFNCMALWRANSGTGRGELTFAKNGTNIATRNLAYVTGSGADHIPVFIQTFIQLAVSDYVQPYAQVSSPGNYYLVERLSWFSGRLVN